MADFKLSAEDLKNDPESMFQMMDKLGEGSYGAVYKAMHKASSTLVALKIVPVDNDLDDILKEISVMTGLQCSAIVQFYGNFIKNDHLWMVIEYCAGGSVADVMKLTKQTMAEKEIACIMKRTIEGLAYLHELRKIHRDIKAGNILLNSKGEAKLADFGVAGQLSDTVAKRNTVIGTPYWMAPEIIQEVGYGVAADIWSLGITCIEMADGHPPHFNIHPMRAIFIIPSRPSPTVEEPPKWSKEFNDFVAKCLTKNPEKRPTATELLKDPFIAASPGPSIMLEKVQKTIELIASGALADEESDDEEADSAVPRRADGTVKASSKASASITAKDMKDMAESVGTMLINESQTTTVHTIQLNNHTTSSDYTPAFMKALKKDTNETAATGTIKASATTKATPDSKPATVEGLNDMLKLLEVNMEKEISLIKNKYERKRQPILEAIRTKKGNPAAV